MGARLRQKVGWGNDIASNAVLVFAFSLCKAIRTTNMLPKEIYSTENTIGLSRAENVSPLISN